MDKFKLDPVYFLFMSSLAMQVALHNCKGGVELIHDMSVYTEIESNIRSRFTSAVRGRVTFNNEGVRGYVP